MMDTVMTERAAQPPLKSVSITGASTSLSR